MSNSVHISSRDEADTFLNLQEIEKIVLDVLKEIDKDNWEISLLFCNDAFIHTLNKEYRNIDNPTDVLSFEQGDEYIDEDDITRFIAGDIIISIDSLKNNAKTFNVPINEELKRLLIHGILHLSGMDHSDNDPKQEMLQKQEAILKLYTSIEVYQE